MTFLKLLLVDTSSPFKTAVNQYLAEKNLRANACHQDQFNIAMHAVACIGSACPYELAVHAFGLHMEGHEGYRRVCRPNTPAEPIGELLCLLLLALCLQDHRTKHDCSQIPQQVEHLPTQLLGEDSSVCMHIHMSARMPISVVLPGPSGLRGSEAEDQDRQELQMCYG